MVLKHSNLRPGLETDFSCMEIMVCVGKIWASMWLSVKVALLQQETQVQFLGQEDPVEEEMAPTQYSYLKIPMD